MDGIEKRGIVIQVRDRELLRELSVLRVADREQAKAAAGFRSTTRVNVRLLALTRAGLLRRFFLGAKGTGRKALYALSAKGAELVHVPFRGPRRRTDETLVADFFIEHQLTVNRLYCSLKFSPIPVAGVTFLGWKSFDEPITPSLRLIPDGYVALEAPAGPLSAFIEVDLGHESLRVWKEKVRQYLQLALSGEFEREAAGFRFRIAVLAHSERRMHSIRSLAASFTEKLFWFTSLDQVEAKGFFGPIWLRPRSDEAKGFIQTP